MREHLSGDNNPTFVVKHPVYKGVRAIPSKTDPTALRVIVNWGLPDQRVAGFVYRLSAVKYETDRGDNRIFKKRSDAVFHVLGAGAFRA